VEEPFWFDVHLFRIHPETVAFLTLSFSQFAVEGIGPRRGKAALVRAETIGLEGEPGFCFFADGVFRQSSFPEPLVMALGSSWGETSAKDDGATRLRVQFLTPTELKQDGRVVEVPGAAVLAARAFDRISALQYFYAEQPRPEDMAREQRRVLMEAAGRLRISRQDLTMATAERISSRTGQKHALEGLLGEVEYEGPRDAVEALLPWLRAAAMTGVGRQTVWGKGEIESTWIGCEGIPIG
jgi:hypothetical protein